jgi:hypothetical protein
MCILSRKSVFHSLSQYPFRPLPFLLTPFSLLPSPFSSVTDCRRLMAVGHATSTNKVSQPITILNRFNYHLWMGFSSYWNRLGSRLMGSCCSCDDALDILPKLGRNWLDVAGRGWTEGSGVTLGFDKRSVYMSDLGREVDRTGRYPHAVVFYIVQYTGICPP